MSSLIWHADAEQAFVATDSLVGDAHGVPVRFASKVIMLPHLRMMMAATGLAGFLERWFLVVNSFYVRGIDELDELAPGALPELWKMAREQLGIPDGMTTTLHHFGFSERTGEMRVLMYTSARDFKPEDVGYGTRAKPVDGLNLDQAGEFPAALRGMMDQQRESLKTASGNAAGQRILIGGEIVVHHLTQRGYEIYINDRFPDFEENDELMRVNRDAQLSQVAERNEATSR